MSRRALHLAPVHCPLPPEAAAAPGSLPPLLLRVTDVCSQLGLSRSAVQRLIASGALRSVSIGRSRRVVAADLQDYVAALADSSHDGPAAR